MVHKFCFILVVLSSILSFAKTNSYFAVTGDRVMVNLRSGYAFTPESDDDAERLYEVMNVLPENSVMGQGKKILSGESFSLIVADRGKGEFDGTIMIYKGEGVHIDPLQKLVRLHWTGERARALFSQFLSSEGKFVFDSTDERLRLEADQSQFTLEFQESMAQGFEK